MQPIVNIALRASRQAREYITSSLDKHDSAQADAHSNQKLLEHLEESLFQTFFDALKKANPNTFIIAPDETPSEDKEDSWKINAIHAGYNLIKKIPATAFSLINKKSGRTQNAVIVNPLNGDEYTASRGNGAALNGRRIRCNATKNIADATIAINTINQIGAYTEPHHASDFVTEIASNAAQIIVSNCATLDVAMVASGQIDAAVLTKVHAAELEAPLLLCQEAGALVGTFNGGVFGKSEDKIIVANPKLFKSLVQRLNGFQAKL